MLKSMTDEEKKQAVNNMIEYLKKAWQAIKEVILKVVEQFKKCLKSWIQSVASIPKNKRDIWTRKLLYYGSIIAGMSNNWRRMHHIPMVRRR